MDSPLVVEDLLILIHDDETGRVNSPVQVGYATGSALVVDLAQAEMIELITSRWGTRLVRLLDRTRTTDPLLVTAADLLAERERSIAEAMGALGKLHRPVMNRLAQRGIVREESSKLLGLIPDRRWPAVNRDDKAELVTQLRGVIGDGAAPGERITILIALLSATGGLKPYVRFDHLSVKQAEVRAKEIADKSVVAQDLKAVLVAAASASVAAVAGGGDGGS